MKLFSFSKDGGPKSRVYGLFFVEWKQLLSVVLLWFKHGSREAYHSHAFNAVSWVLWGKLTEHRMVDGRVCIRIFRPSLVPVITTRDNFQSDVDSEFLCAFLSGCLGELLDGDR